MTEHGCILYAGDELDLAYERSRLRAGLLCRQRARAGRLAKLRHDLANADLRQILPRRAWVEGREQDSSQALTVLFSGTLRTLDYCARSIFGNDDWQVTAGSSSGASPDIVVTDHPLGGSLSSTLPAIRTPQWVRQELQLAETWSATLSRVPRRLRKELGRLLRKYGYRPVFVGGEQAIRDFREDLLLPSVRERYGSEAIVASAASFYRECRGMTRLDLLSGESVVAASLVESDGRRLCIRKSALRPGRDALPGRADVLDYFTLLLAQLAGCRVLDFGLSRPHLEDGTFRYKAKWGTRVVPAGGPKASIRISPRRETPAVLSFLGRNRFLERAGDGFVVRVPADNDRSTMSWQHLERLANVSGIRCAEFRQ